MATTHKISSTDLIMANLSWNGRTMASIAKSNFTSIDDVVRLITTMAGKCVGHQHGHQHRQQHVDKKPDEADASTERHTTVNSILNHEKQNSLSARHYEGNVVPNVWWSYLL